MDLNALVALQMHKQNQLRYSKRSQHSHELLVKSEIATLHWPSDAIAMLHSLFRRRRMTQSSIARAVPAE